jgi:hypothetical protein
MRFRSLAFALALTLAFSAGMANAQVVVTFNDLTESPSITISGTSTAIVVPLPGEDFQVILMGVIAPGGPNFSDVFALRESAGGPISDLVYFSPFASIAGALQIEFVSNTDGVPLIPNPASNLYGSAVETGASQTIPLPTDVVPTTSLTINVLSDLESVPEPSVLALAGTGGLLGLGLWGYRRRKA